MTNIAINQKSNSCEGCYNISSYIIINNLLPSQDIIYYCNCNPSDVYEFTNYIHFEYHIIDDPTTKPTWCPLS